MFWMAALFSGLALVFVKVGVMSVTIKLLGLALSAVILVAIVLGGVLLWKSIKN